MRKMIIVVLFIVLPMLSSSQNHDLIQKTTKNSTSDITMFDIRRNAVYNEDLLAFCYERLLPVTDKFGIALKGGIVIFDPFLLIGEVATVFGGPKHFAETGIGAIPDIIYGGGFFTIRAGYRYQAPKGFLFWNFLIPNKNISLYPINTDIKTVGIPTINRS